MTKKLKAEKNHNSASDRIRLAIDALNKENIKLTTLSIGTKLGVSKQRAHQMLKLNGFQTNFQPSKEIVSKLENVDTDKFTVEELKNIVGYKEPTSKFYNLLISNEIYFKGKLSLYGKYLKSFDSSKYTVTQLQELCKYPRTENSFREYLRRNAIPYKRKSREEMKKRLPKTNINHIMIKLSKIDTSQKTVSELASIIEYKGVKNNLYAFFKKHNIQFKPI
jgi:phage antirepressor YoqD-like protein